MDHPFALEISDLEAFELEYEEHLTIENAVQVEGGILPGGCVLTKAWHEGGYFPPICPPIKPICPPTVTTLALGEEGGYYH